MTLGDGDSKEIERRLADIQEKQNQIGRDQERLMRVIFGDDDNPMGIKRKVDEVYETVTNWQDQWQGAKRVFVGILFLVTSGAGAAIWTLLRGFLEGRG